VLFRTFQHLQLKGGGPQFQVGLYRICFWEIWPEPDVAGFVKQIRPEPVPELDFTMKLVISKFLGM